MGLNNDTLGGILKSSLAQYLALEISKGNERDAEKEKKYELLNTISFLSLSSTNYKSIGPCSVISLGCSTLRVTRPPKVLKSFWNAWPTSGIYRAPFVRTLTDVQ